MDKISVEDYIQRDKSKELILSYRTDESQDYQIQSIANSCNRSKSQVIYDLVKAGLSVSSIDPDVRLYAEMNYKIDQKIIEIEQILINFDAISMKIDAIFFKIEHFLTKNSHKKYSDVCIRVFDKLVELVELGKEYSPELFEEKESKLNQLSKNKLLKGLKK